MLKNLLGLKKSLPQSPGSLSTTTQELPRTIELIEDKLSVTVFTHQVTTQQGTFLCLSYATKGFQLTGQKELVLTLKNTSQQYQVQEAPLLFFKQIYPLAENGRRVSNGDITQFGERGLLGWKGIVYTNFVDSISNLNQEDYLSMILLTLEEVQAVQAFGYLRLMALLGKENAFYPYPFWSDLDRRALPIGQIEQVSILGKIRARLCYPAAWVVLDNNQIILTLPRQSPAEVFPQEKLSAPFALLPGLHPGADGCLVFTLDNQGPTAITPAGSEGSKLSGCVLVLVGEQAQTSSRIIEDGFAVLMTDKDWTLLGESLIERRPMSWSMNDNGMDFKLQWN